MVIDFFLILIMGIFDFFWLNAWIKIGLFGFFIQIAAAFSLLSGLQSIPHRVKSMWLIIRSHARRFVGLSTSSETTIQEVWLCIWHLLGVSLVIEVFLMLRFMCRWPRKLFKDQYVLKYEGSLRILQIRLCVFRLLLFITILVETFLFVRHLMRELCV